MPGTRVAPDRRRRRIVIAALATTAVVLGLVAAFAVSAGGPDGSDGSGDSVDVAGLPSAAPSAGRGVTLPAPHSVFDYQIGGGYAPASDVAVVDRDRSGSPVPGKYNICYINGFQTQPGESSGWPAALLLHGPDGQRVEDPNWPDEYLLDTRTQAARNGIMNVLRPWLQDCARKGFQAVEPDNLDSWARSDGMLTPQDNAALAVDLVRAAHGLGLAVAQKNAVELAAVGKSRIGFDFAIAEECHAQGECQGYVDTYAGRVFEIEYPDDGGSANFQAACSALGDRISIIYRDRKVVPAQQSGYLYRHC